MSSFRLASTSRVLSWVLPRRLRTLAQWENAPRFLCSSAMPTWSCSGNKPRLTLDLERWLQTVVYLYNSGPAQKIEESWQFLAASPDRMRTLCWQNRLRRRIRRCCFYGRSGAGQGCARAGHSSSQRPIERALYRHQLRRTARNHHRKRAVRNQNGGPTPEPSIALDSSSKRTTEHCFSMRSGNSWALQVKLLRVPGNALSGRVGAGGEEKPVNVRSSLRPTRIWIAWSKKDLPRDLLFRLDSMKLVIPDLGPSDVRALCPPLLLELVRRGWACFPATKASRSFSTPSGLCGRATGASCGTFWNAT